MKIGKEVKVFVVLNIAVAATIGLGCVFGYFTPDELLSMFMGINIGAFISYAVRTEG